MLARILFVVQFFALVLSLLLLPPSTPGSSAEGAQQAAAKKAAEEAKARAAAAANTLKLRQQLQQQGQPPAPPPPPIQSDIRLKKDVVHLTTLGNGLRLYSFRYLWSDVVHVGVMAQDLLFDPAYRDAVILQSSGYYAVDYARLG